MDRVSSLPIQNFDGMVAEIWHRRCKQEGIVTKERHDELVRALDDDPILNEIQQYRNLPHQFAGVIVTLHDGSTDAFIAHALPPLDAEQRAPLDEAEIRKEVQERELNVKLKAYCNHLGGYCGGLFRTIEANHKLAVIPRSQGFSRGFRTRTKDNYPNYRKRFT